MKNKISEIENVTYLIKETLNRLYNASEDEQSKLLFYYEKCLSLLNNTKIFKTKFGVEPYLVRGVLAELLCEVLAETFLAENDIQGKVISNSLIDRFPKQPDKNVTTQLDVVIITDRGLFIIECKSLFGKLKTDGDYMISQNLEKQIFPWNQNQGHINSLLDNLQIHLNLSSLHCNNIVFVFSIGKFVEWDEPRDPYSYLLVPQGSLARLKTIYDSMEKYTSIDQNSIERIYNFLEERIPTAEEMEEHIQILQDYFNTKGE